MQKLIKHHAVNELNRTVFKYNFVKTPSFVKLFKEPEQ